MRAHGRAHVLGGVGPRFGNRDGGDRIHTGIQLAKRAPATRTVSMGLWTLLPRRHAHTRGAACKNYPRHVQFIRGMRTFSTVSYTHLRAHETPEHLVCR